MKKLLYSSLAIAAMAVSCQEAELENNGAANNGEVFRIEVPISETKTVYTPPTKVTWATGDEITVIVNGTDANKFTNSEGDYFETTEFIPEAGTEYTYHAFYPYSSFVKSIDEAITVTFTVKSESGEKTVTLTHRSSSQTTVEDVLTADLFTATSTTYTEFSNVKVSSSAVYAGKSAYNKAIQLRSKESDCGIVTTASGGKVKTIEIKWNEATTNARILWIYGSNEPYTSATELYESNLKGERIAEIAKSDGLSQTFEVTDDYSYIGLRSSDGAMYIDSITITWEE